MMSGSSRRRPRVIRRAIRSRDEPSLFDEGGPDVTVQDDVAEAHEALNGLKQSLMRGAEKVVDHQLRKRGLDPELAKDVVRRGVALSRALRERHAHGGGAFDTVLDEFFPLGRGTDRREELEVWDDSEEFEPDYSW